MSPPPHSLPRRGATTICVPRASLPDLPEEAKVKTLLRSVGVLDGWLEDNDEGRSEDEVRLRRIKRWREEALEQLGLELNRTRPYPPPPCVPAGSGPSPPPPVPDSRAA